LDRFARAEKQTLKSPMTVCKKAFDRKSTWRPTRAKRWLILQDICGYKES
jgi:hypothetical protein